MFTTQGATRSTALTTAREYSSKSAVSAGPVVVLLDESRSEFVSLSKNSCRASGSKLVIVILGKFRIGRSIRQLPAAVIYTANLEGCPLLVPELKRRHG